jgi:hypothetical protein
MNPVAAIRDSNRQRKKTAGLSGSSEEGPQYLGSGATQDDGSQASIDVADARSSDSLTTAARSEATQQIVSSFAKAMSELKDEDPLWAMLVCLRLDLGCAQNGTMPERNAERLLRVSVASDKEIKTPENFWAKLGVGQNRGDSERAFQELTKRIQDGNFWDALKDKKGRKRRSAPRMPDGSVMSEMPSDPKLAAEWNKFKNTVRDALGEAFKWLSKRMNEIIGEESRVASKGQTGPKDWSLLMFLKRSFSNASVKVERSMPDKGVQDVSVKFPDGKSFLIWTQWQEISVEQEGFEEELSLEIPDIVPCSDCGGRDENCPTCHGQKMIIDPNAIRAMEWKLYNFLIRDRRRTSADKQA